MQFLSKAAAFDQYKSDCSVLFIDPKAAPNNHLLQADIACSGALSKGIKSGDFKEELGSTLWFYPTQGKSQRLLIVSIYDSKQKGKAKKEQALTAEQVRKISVSTAKALAAKNVSQASIHLDALSIDTKQDIDLEQITHQLSCQITVSLYRYTTTKPGHAPLPTLKKVTFCHEQKEPLASMKKGCASGSATATGINTARELGNLPGNICTPTFLADQAKELAKQSPKLTTTILNPNDMAKLGMHSLLSVAAGSDQPAKLIVMEYKGKTTKSPHVLVGKGITFDTGGISLKPGGGMDEMKFDMCGAASVAGTMQALVEMKAPVHVVGVIAAAENMPSGGATKPGDVVTSMSGKTIEILNTDAEGRLVLCDALTYVEKFKPKSVIDIATLTGACVIALGHHATGLYANQQDLADKLIEAGQMTHDRAWQMPLWDDYTKSLKSNFADLANIGGREGGSITAACFLSEFTKSYPWAHLDIAGSAWNSGGNKGATGRPVSLLLHYLLHNA